MITLKQAAAFCGGAVLPQYEQIAFTGAAIDSRTVEPGQLLWLCRVRVTVTISSPWRSSTAQPQHLASGSLQTCP